MKIIDEFDYRNAKAIIEAKFPGLLDEIRHILLNPNYQFDLTVKGKQRNLSAQVQEWFVKSGWKKEWSSPTIPEMRYDLFKEQLPIEIELGHQRLVFPDFFKFLADYSKDHIPAAVMIVTGNPDAFGHDWHCSLNSTKKKIESVKEVFLVPLLLIAVDPQ